MVGNPPSNAGDAGLIHGRGTKIPHATGQLSPRAATREKPARRNEDPEQPKEKKEKKTSRSLLGSKYVGHSRQRNYLLPKKKAGGWLPWCAVVKNPPANAGDTGSSPGLGRSHMPRSNKACAPELLSLHSRACEPRLLSPCATTTETRMPGAHALQQEKPLQ